MTDKHSTNHFNRPQTRQAVPARVSSLACTAALCVITLPMPGNAAPLPLAQVPAGNGGREPPPNVILSVDDSGSMNFELESGGTRMDALKAALRSSFSTTTIPDDSIRLGFQAMWRCRDFGPTAYYRYGDPCPENRVRPFSGSHRAGFNSWVESLQPDRGTPSHLMVLAAGNFMQTTGVWNPYANVPGTTEEPLLACRKSYHIFMTDGEWNSADRNVVGADNWDGTTRTRRYWDLLATRPEQPLDETEWVSDDRGAFAVHWGRDRHARRL